VFKTICKGWEISKSKIVAKQPANEQEWLALPLWTPQVNHVNPKIVNCLTNPKQLIANAGFERMKHVVKPDGSFRQWDDGPGQQLPQRCKEAYEKMLHNLWPAPHFTTGGGKKKTVYLEDPTQAKVWEFQMPVHMIEAAIIKAAPVQQPTRSYCLRFNDLVIDNTTALPSRNVLLKPVIITKCFSAAQRRKVKLRVGEIAGRLKITEQYSWSDERPLFSTSTSHMRKL
jgi:hypothetical protein